jgi:glycosyltransferase involved in cell wall biosynthesis
LQVSKMPKTLLVSRSVPPGASGSSVIIGNLARQFSRDEMVIVGAWFVDSPPVEWRAEWPRLIYATINPADGWRGGRLIRWGQFPWLLLRSLWACLWNRCEVILGVYPDEIYLFTAYLVSVISGKPLYLYFHNTYLEHGRGAIMAEWLQPRAFKRARHTFVMSKAMQALYTRYYPDLVCSPLVHTYNETPPDPQRLPSLSAVGSPLRLVLSGSVNASNEGAVQHLAAAIKRLPDAELWIYSKTNTHYLKQLGVDLDNSQFHLTTVSRDTLIAELQKADILFLPHGFSDREGVEEIETIFPTRTIEYLIAGRPILAHMPDRCFIADFLREHQCALVVTDPDPEVLKAAVDRLTTDVALREQLVHNAVRAAGQFYAPVVARHLRETIQENAVKVVSRVT